MKLGVYQKVELNNGEVHRVNKGGKGDFSINGWRYTSDGRLFGWGEDHRLSVKRIIKEPDSKPEWPDLSNPDKVPLEDMTDEQQAFLLLADHRGCDIDLLGYGGWVDCKNPSFSSGSTYRIKPAAPSWLPLEVGKVYVDGDGVERHCIGVEGNKAWLTRSAGVWAEEAYVWRAGTGVSCTLFSDLTGPAENTEGED